MVFFAVLIALGCASDRAPDRPAAELPAAAIPLNGESHTFALYNDQNRLIHSPIEHLDRELARRAAGGRPISDIYVLAHGWNFTLEESASLWENYRIAAEATLRKLRADDPAYEPFLIFVAWSSVTRPLTTAVDSLSPFTLPSLIRGATGVADSVVFHLVSNWGETQDAFHIALGRHRRREFDPSTYATAAQPSQYREAVRLEREQSATRPFRGYDAPVSVLLDELLRIKFAPGKPRFRLHVVGHSYGGKIAALASFDALSRIFLAAQEGRFPKCEEECDGYLDSLLLINAAMKMSELYTPSDLPEGVELKFESLARSIPRKGIVYTRHDSATGWVFGVSQMLLNNEYISEYNDYAIELESIGIENLEQKPGLVRVLLRAYAAPVEVFNFALVFGSTATMTTLTNAFSFVAEPLSQIIRVFDEDTAGEKAVRLLSVPFAPFTAQRGLGSRGLGRVGFVSSVTAPWLHDAQGYLGDRIDEEDERFVALSTYPLLAGTNPVEDEEHFYTYDADDVYDGYSAGPFGFASPVTNQLFPPGAHGDVRSYDLALGLPKRERSLAFIYNFTRRRPGASGSPPD